jgi:hypothetical protein
MGAKLAEQPTENREARPTRRRATREGKREPAKPAQGDGKKEARTSRRRSPPPEKQGDEETSKPSLSVIDEVDPVDAARRAAEEAVRQVAPEVARKAAREVARQVAPEAAREAARQVAPEAARETAREVARHVAPEAAREATRQAARLASEAAREAAQSVASEVARETARQAAIARAREVAREVAPEAARETARQVAREAAPEETRVSRRERANQGSWQNRLARATGPVIAVIVGTVLSTMIVSVVVHDEPAARVADIIFNRDDPPVQFLSILERDYGAQGETWTLPEKLGSLDVVDQATLKTASIAPDDFQKWVRARGGVDVGVSYIRLVVTSQQFSKILITDMHAEVEKRDKPLKGTLFYAPPQGGTTNSIIGLNLDETKPIAREISPDKDFREAGYLGAPYFRERSVTLTSGEQHIFNIVALTKKYHCLWYLKLSMYVNDELKEFDVGLPANVGQKPFQITARADPGTNKQGNFSVYEELWVWDGQSPGGFDKEEPNLYTD